MKNEIKKNPYAFVWGNYQSLLTLEANFQAIAYHRDKEWNNINQILQISQDNNIKCFHGIKDLKRDKIRGRKFLDREYGENFVRQINRNYKNSWKLFKKLKAANYKKLSNRELLDLLKEAKNNWIEQMSYFRALQTEGSFALVNELKKDVSKKEYDILIHRTEKDISEIELLEWQKIVKKKEISNKILLRHVDRFPWLVAAHFSMTEVMDTLKTRLKTSSSIFIENKINKNLFLKQKEILAKKSNKAKHLVDMVHKLSVTRMKIKSCWSGLDYYLIPLFGEIYFRTDENVMDLNKYYITEDIEKLLLHNKKISRGEKEKRRLGIAWMLKNGKLIIKSGKEALGLAKTELGDLWKNYDVKEFKGTVANPGCTKGIVRVLLANNVSQAKECRKNFKKGEILVTQMTQPNILDIAKRAGAIITNEGGLLSHAAIISREINIPCIVGTKIATDVLKDGNLVEVDADKGIVRIIKKA